MTSIKYDSGGISVLIVCLSYRMRMISGTSFRGREEHFAGNFHQWETLVEVLADESLKNGFIKRIDELIKSIAFGSHSMTFTCPSNVGWESTDDLSLFNADELEEFKPNRQSNALRLINPGLRGRKAPETKDVTIGFTLKRKHDELKVCIDSLQPGTDVGDLVGDITKKTRRVFYDWEHPGTQPAS